jgi:hypothetical protein
VRRGAAGWIRVMFAGALAAGIQGSLAAEGFDPGYPEPPALRPGQSTELRLNSAVPELEWWTGIPTEGPASTVVEGQARRTLSTPVATPGRWVFRVHGQGQLSPWRMALVDPLPVLEIPAKAQDSAEPVELRPPVAVDGTIPANGSRRFAVPLRRQERVTLEVVARRLGSPLDPRLRLRDPAGRVVAEVDDLPGLEGDGWIEYRATTPGRHVIEVSDTEGDGGGQHRFRLRVHGGEPEWFPYLPVEGAGLAPGSVSDRPRIEASPDARLSGPTTVMAAFTRPGQPLRYRLQVGAKEAWRVALRTRLRGSRADVLARFETREGKVLAESDATTSEDGTLNHVFAEAGEVRLVLTELSGGAGRGYGFEFELEPGGPDFGVAVDRETAEVKPGGTVEFKVTVARQGYDGALSLAADGLPADFRLEGTQIEAKKKEGVLKLVAPTNAVPGTLRFFRLHATGSGKGESRVVPVSTRKALRAAWPELLCPPPGLDGVVTLWVQRP